MTDNDEWSGTLTFNIQGARMLYNHLDYSLKMWPGSPARPAEEQEMIINLKNHMFAMKMDYNLHN